ncbi:MAG: peptidylprolyl isomerase [Candidatus Cloacimonadales bacterium]|nr:peptidylprolyl isomerase [Candidatus Cloacimonadales bacterium]
MKYLLCFVLLIFGFTLFGEIVASVGDYMISSNELAEEMKNLQDSENLTYSQVRQIALDNLIEKYTLMTYADENGIVVDAAEIQAFFVRELGDLPRFQTGGVFDSFKYQEFIHTPNGKNIIDEMSKEILVNKTRTLVENSFDISDNNLLRQFFLENTEIDLGYAIIDVEDANIPGSVSLPEAEEIYFIKKNKFNQEQKVKLKFFLVSNADFKETVVNRVHARLENAVKVDSLLTHLDLQKMYPVFEAEETAGLALQKSIQLREILAKGDKVFYPILESSYLGINETMGKIPNSIIKMAFESKKSVWSDPINIGNAYLVFQVEDFKKFDVLNETVSANEFWRRYLKSETEFSSDYQDYFNNHIDKFTVNIAIVDMVDISKPPLFSSLSKQAFVENIRSQIQENIDDQNEVRKIIKDSGLEIESKILYLETFKNDTVVENVIAGMINKNSTYGFLPSNKGLVFFQVISYFPDYIPFYEKIKDQMPLLVELAQTDTTDFRAYFESHKKDFMSPDSLRLGGVIFKTQEYADSLVLEVSDEALEDIYHQNIDNYYRKRSVEFDFIFVQDEETARIVEQQAKAGFSFSLLKFCFSRKYPLPTRELTEYDELPRVIRESLSRILNNTFYQPIEYDNGWFILYKIKEYEAGIAPFAAMKKKIKDDLIWKEAKNLAYSDAKAIFDSTSYFSHLSGYFSPDQIFETAYQNADQDFEFIGSIKEYKTDLMRIWRNEKFSSIIRTKDGFAVIFVLRKHSAEPMTYEEALPKIEGIFAAKNRYDKAHDFVNKLRSSVIKGAAPDSLFLFFGGWLHAQNLSLTSNIPRVDFSKDIMDDILNRDEGYCSNVISINDKQLMFYYVERLKRPGNNEYYSQKSLYSQRFIESEYNNWLRQYKAKIDIKIK